MDYAFVGGGGEGEQDKMMSDLVVKEKLGVSIIGWEVCVEHGVSSFVLEYLMLFSGLFRLSLSGLVALPVSSLVFLIRVLVVARSSSWKAKRFLLFLGYSTTKSTIVYIPLLIYNIAIFHFKLCLF